jgi:hypothetical protein
MNDDEIQLDSPTNLRAGASGCILKEGRVGPVGGNKPKLTTGVSPLGNRKMRNQLQPKLSMILD